MHLNIRHRRAGANLFTGLDVDPCYYLLHTFYILGPCGISSEWCHPLSYQMSLLLFGCFADWPTTPPEGSTVNRYVLGSSLDATNKLSFHSFSFIHSQWLPISAALVSPWLAAGGGVRQNEHWGLPHTIGWGSWETEGRHRQPSRWSLLWMPPCPIVLARKSSSFPLLPMMFTALVLPEQWPLHACIFGTAGPCSHRNHEQRCRQYIFLIYVLLLSCGNVGKSSSVHTPRWHTAPSPVT